MEQAEHVLKLTNKRKAAWARRRWAEDGEWREMKKAGWRSRYYEKKSATAALSKPQTNPAD